MTTLDTMSTQTTLTAAEANALPHDNPLRSMTWADVTREARKAYIAERYEFWMSKAKSQTSAQKDKARRLASADAISWNYNLVEMDGYRNPLQDDMVWGPNREDAQEAQADYKPNRYGGRCPKCNQWVEEQKGKLVKLDSGKWGAEHLTCPEVSQPEEKSSQPVKGLDLTDVPSGYYAVPGGDTRLKVRISHGKEGSKWEGYTFVTDGAAYGQQQRYGMQRPGQAYKGQIESQLQAIAADPLEASKAYGHLVGRCGRCNTILEDEESVANGIGPICATKF